MDPDYNFYRQTPSVRVLDNRGLSVRNIEYHRYPGKPTVTDERITRQQFDRRGFLMRSSDPRLYDIGQANFICQTDLAGNALRTQSTDAGITVALNDAAGRPLMTVTGISAGEEGKDDLSQAVTCTFQYEGDTLPGRVLSVTDQVTGAAARITERFVYASASQQEKELNLAGACVRHYDTAGLLHTESIALTGAPLSITRQLLPDEHPADWQGTTVADWDQPLASALFTTQSVYDATGTLLNQSDAMGHQQRQAWDIAGLLKGSWLTLNGKNEQVIVKSVSYSAAGQKLREEHGNGVVTTYTWEPETQRLIGIKTDRPAGRAAGAKVLQDLRYDYDPVGNVLSMRNDAEETRFWRNQKVVPENTYTYDSLYQLVSATGREMANAGQQGSSLPSATVLFPTDSSAYTNYTRTYTYDSAGNLTQIRHNAPATRNGYTTAITVSDRSNRGVLSTLTENPAEVDALFTAGGHQKELLPGQNLTWTPRGELLRVTPVVRDGQPSDHETYRYDAGSQRIIKRSVQQSAGSTQTRRALYLPGLELRTRLNGTRVTETLHTVAVGEAGRAQVRALHWEAGKPDDIADNPLRYSYDNLIGSSALEVDGNGRLISCEEYYPYGGTAVSMASSQTEADYKTVRYSGKERDATGLYYYGYRYYQPWLARWLSADPAGTVDGLNLFRMARNNPVSWRDNDGRKPENIIEITEKKSNIKNKEDSPKTSEYVKDTNPLLNSLPHERRSTVMYDKSTLEYAVSTLGKHFKIVSDAKTQSEQLVITAHGAYLPWSDEITIPSGLTLKFLNPHNTFLVDPGISNVVGGEGDITFVSANSKDVLPKHDKAKNLFNEGNRKSLTGSKERGKTRNYVLQKYGDDSIEALVNALSVNRTFSELQDTVIKSDFLMVRGRSIANPLGTATLRDVLDALATHGIQYKSIVCSFCRIGASTGIQMLLPEQWRSRTLSNYDFNPLEKSRSAKARPAGAILSHTSFAHRRKMVER